MCTFTKQQHLQPTCIQLFLHSAIFFGNYCNAWKRKWPILGWFVCNFQHLHLETCQFDLYAHCVSAVHDLLICCWEKAFDSYSHFCAMIWDAVWDNQIYLLLSLLNIRELSVLVFRCGKTVFPSCLHLHREKKDGITRWLVCSQISFDCWNWQKTTAGFTEKSEGCTDLLSQSSLGLLYWLLLKKEWSQWVQYLQPPLKLIFIDR